MEVWEQDTQRVFERCKRPSTPAYSFRKASLRARLRHAYGIDRQIEKRCSEIKSREHHMRIHLAHLGFLIWLVSLNSSGYGAEDGIRLRERFPEGYQYHVNCRVQLSGSLTLQPDTE